MSREYETLLEKRIHEELRTLRELQAPNTLSAKVMALIHARTQTPWYRLAWSLWPLPLRIASLTALLVLFAGICYAGWILPQTPLLTAGFERAHRVTSVLTSFWNVLNALLSLVALLVKNINTGVLVGCLAAIGLGYAAFMGLGTVYFRLAMTRRQ